LIHIFFTVNCIHEHWIRIEKHRENQRLSRSGGFWISRKISTERGTRKVGTLLTVTVGFTFIPTEEASRLSIKYSFFNDTLFR
jgi:hypothetical protein